MASTGLSHRCSVVVASRIEAQALRISNLSRHDLCVPAAVRYQLITDFIYAATLAAQPRTGSTQCRQA
jgi:hypothetical protein